MKVQSTHEACLTGEQLRATLENKVGFNGPRISCKIMLIFDDGDIHREVPIDELSLVRVSWTTEKTLR